MGYFMNKSLAILFLGSALSSSALSKCPTLTNEQIMGTVCGDKGSSLAIENTILFPLGSQKDICVNANSPDKSVTGTEKPQRQCVYTIVSSWGNYFPFSSFTLISTAGDPKGTCPDVTFSTAALFTDQPSRAFDGKAETNTPENWFLSFKDYGSFQEARKNFPGENLASSVSDLTPPDTLLKGQKVETPPPACVYGTQTMGVIAAKSPP